MNSVPSKVDIEGAFERIGQYIHYTPVLTNSYLNSLTGAELFFKCENFQKVGAFKARGAHNAASLLSQKELENGLATHSSGNHAQAVALAAKTFGVKAYIVMPESAPKVKVEAVKGYGAEVIFCKPTLEAREESLEEVIESTKAHLVHPYDDYRVIAGQATCAKELIEQKEDLDCMLCPVGGGGLLSGTILSARYFADKDMKVFAGEPAGADDAYRSLKSGELRPSENPDTIADGLLASLGTKTWPIIRDGIHDIFLTEDSEIINAMRLIWERMKIVVEPSCAVPLAVAIKHKEIFENKKVGIILTGGNVDLKKLPF